MLFYILHVRKFIVLKSVHFTKTAKATSFLDPAFSGASLGDIQWHEVRPNIFRSRSADLQVNTQRQYRDLVNLTSSSQKGERTKEYHYMSALFWI
jgi:hypothetical protein